MNCTCHNPAPTVGIFAAIFGILAALVVAMALCLPTLLMWGEALAAKAKRRIKS